MPKVYLGLPFSGGINLFQAPHDIGDDEAVQLKNLYPKYPGQLQTRPSTAAMDNLLGDSVGLPIKFQFLPVNTSAVFLVCTRNVGHTDQPAPINTFAQAFPESTGSNITFLASVDLGTVTKYEPAVQPYQRRVYVFGGLGCLTTGQVLEDGVFTPFSFSGSNNSAMRPCVVGVYRDRFVYADFGPGFESAFAFADPFLPNVVGDNLLTDSSSYGLVNPNDGDRIVAIHEVLRTGQSDIQSSCLVLKEFSGYLFTGEPPLADGTAVGSAIPELTVNRMPVDCGCSSAASLCATPYGLIWAGPDDVWMFPEGQLPFRVGTKIRPALQQSPPNLRYRWHAVYHDGFYKLAVHSADQGPTDDSACNEQYWIDLRSGPPQSWRDAKWFGPQIHLAGTGPDIGTHCMAVDIRPGKARDLWSLQHSEALTTTTSRLLSHTGADSHDAAIVGPTFAGRQSTWNTEIISEIITKELKNIVQGGNLVADAIMEKGLLGVEVDVNPSASGQFGWQWVLNSGRTVSAVQTKSLDRLSGLILPGPLDSSVLSDETTPLSLDPAPARVVGRAIQLRLFNRAGYYINASNAKIALLVEVAPTVFISISAAIPYGLYSGHVAVLQAAIDQLAPFLVPYGVTIIVGSDTPLKLTSSAVLDLRYGSIYTGADSQVEAFANLVGFSQWGSSGYAGSVIQGSDSVYPKNTYRMDLPSGATVSLYTIPRRLL